MELIGETTRAWAKDRWDELLAKLPDLNADRTDALICALGDIGGGLKAIGDFVRPRTRDVMDPTFSRDLGEVILGLKSIDLTGVHRPTCVEVSRETFRLMVAIAAAGKRLASDQCHASWGPRK